MEALTASMVSRPPLGMASRALMARLSSAFSICDGSTKQFHNPPETTVSTSMVSPSVRRSISSMPETSRPIFMVFGSSASRTEARARRRAQVPACSIAPPIAGLDREPLVRAHPFHPWAGEGRHVVGVNGGVPVECRNRRFLDAPEVAQRRIEVKAFAVRVAHPEHHRRALRDQMETLFAFGNGRGRADTVGDGQYQEDDDPLG